MSAAFRTKQIDILTVPLGAALTQDLRKAIGNTAAEQKEYLKKFEADLITSEEAAKWKRGASNAGYHYLGCAKTFALMGKAFADANLQMLNAQKR